jgi:hypothetical protein
MGWRSRIHLLTQIDRSQPSAAAMQAPAMLLVRRSMIEVYRLSGTKIHHPISILISCFCADCRP